MGFDWAIWKADVTASSFSVMPETELPPKGFATVYRYTEKDAETFNRLGSYKGFKGVVFSPSLKIDVDTSEAAEQVQDTLREHKLSFSRFTTGNRGKHFLIKREAKESHLLPLYDRWLVSQLFPVSDMSIYHHVAMYRQPGCVHQKTGQPKKLELWRPGNSIPDRFEEFSKARTSEQPVKTGSNFQSIFGDKELALLCKPLRGTKRHNTLSRIALRLRRLGQTKEFTLGILQNMVAWTDESIAVEELCRMVDWAFSQE